MQNLPELAKAALQRDAAMQAVEFEGRWIDWGTLRRTAELVVASLDTAQVPASAPIAFIPRNRPSSIAAFLALLAQGRTILMIYAFQSDQGIARDLERLKPAAVVAEVGDFGPETRAACKCGGIVAVALEGMEAHLLDGLDKSDRTEKEEDAAQLPEIRILTSGTTGPPKQSPIAYSLLEQHFLNSPLARQQGTDPQAAPPFMLYFPLGNISGIYSTLPVLIHGQRAILLERFSIAGWHDYIVRYRPTHSGLPPSFVQMVVDADFPRDDFASLVALGVGAAPLDPEAQRAFEDKYGIPIILSYGATEFAGPVACMTPELHAEWGRKKLGTVGRAMPGAKLRVVDPESGAELPAGSEGLLEVVSPRIGPDWIRTSDLAVIDEDGFLFHRGRADGAIMRGGFKVLPETIERALMTHEAVSEAAVTAIPDSRLGQVPAAAVRLKDGAGSVTPDQLESHLRSLVLATHIPVKWLICDEIPRTPSLKYDRPALRALFSDS